MFNNELSNPSKSVANLFFSGLALREELRLQDLPNAFTALRSYGATEEESLEVLSHEVSTLRDYETNQANSIAPDLIDVFGIQHVKDAISYAYLFMEDFELSCDQYKYILTTLLKVYKPEQLILNPELIRYFLIRLNLSDKDKFESINDLENSIIRNMAEEKPLYQICDEE